jgi:hypothetical protein
VNTSNTVECARCGHVNPEEGHRCERCNHHLHIVCQRCGQRIPRIHRYAHHAKGGERCGAPRRSRTPDLVVGLAAFGVGAIVFTGVLALPTLRQLAKEREEKLAVELARKPASLDLLYRQR